MVELREAEMLAHHMESYLRALRQRETALSQAGVDALIGGVDALERVVAARRDNRRLAAGQLRHARHRRGRPCAVARPRRRRSGRGGAPAVFAPWIVTFTPSAALNARGINVDTRPGAPSRARDDPARGAEDPRHRHRVRVRVRRRSRRRDARGMARRRADRRAIGPAAGRGGRGTRPATSPRRPCRPPPRTTCASISRARRADADDRRPGHQPGAARRHAGPDRAARARRSSGARCRRTARRSSASCATCAKG